MSNPLIEKLWERYSVRLSDSVRQDEEDAKREQATRAMADFLELNPDVAQFVQFVSWKKRTFPGANQSLDVVKEVTDILCNDYFDKMTVEESKASQVASLHRELAALVKAVNQTREAPKSLSLLANKYPAMFSNDKNRIDLFALYSWLPDALSWDPNHQILD